MSDQLSRRRFLSSLAGGALVAATSAACAASTPVTGSNSARGPIPTVGPATPGLHQRLDTLLSLYEGLGKNVASGLRPPASEAQLDGVAEFLGFDLPADVRQLWSWHNGWVDSPEGDPLWFRDNWLTGTPEVTALHEQIQYYDDSDLGVDLARCVPIAEFEGSVYAVASGPQTLLPGHPHPVISFFEGVDPFFHSISTMVETAIAWVSDPDYDPAISSGPNDRIAWRRLNPDIPFL